MISLIVLLTLSLTAMIAGGYYFYTLMYSQNMQLKAQKNELFLQNVKNNIVTKSRALGDLGEYALPYGEESVANYHTVPKWVFSERKNPWGNYVIYCPFGITSNGTLSNTVSLDSTNSYSVGVVNDFRTEYDGVSKDYVIASQYEDIDGDTNLEKSPDLDGDGSADDILGFLISPFPNKSNAIPSCKDITYLSTEEVFDATGGTVVPIYENEVESYNKVAATTPTLENRGYSFDIDNVGSNTLNNNLSYFKNYPDKRKIYFYLGDDTHSFDTISFENNDRFDKEVIFVGVEDDPGTATVEKSVITSTSTSSTLAFDNYNVTLKDVAFDDSTRLQISNGNLYTEGNTEISTPYLEHSEWLVKGNSTVVASSLNNISDVLNGTVSSLFLKNSELMIDDDHQLTVNLDSSDDWGIYGFGSRITIEGNSVTNNIVVNHNGHSGNYGFVMYQSEIYIRDANIYLDSTTSQVMGIYLDGDSKYNAFNGRLDLSGRETVGVYLRGEMESIGHDVRNRNYYGGTNPIIDMRDGAHLILRGGAAIGNDTNAEKPYIGIIDNGAGFVGGNSTGADAVQVYAQGKCWQGPSTTEPRIFEATHLDTGTDADIGENGSSTLVKDTNDPNYEVYKLSNNSNWNCNK